MAEKTDYSGNSQQAKAAPPEKAPVEKVVSGDVKVKKKPFGQKFRETFMATDGKQVKDYIVNDVLLPSARDLIFDMINKGVGRLMYGERGRIPGIGGGTFGGGMKTPYATPVNRMFGMGGIQTASPGQRMFQAPGLQPASPDDFVLPSREDAEVIIEAVNDRLQAYGTVSVYELKRMLGLQTNHAENKWGWDNLRGARIDPSRDGWIMVLPTPIVLQ